MSVCLIITFLLSFPLIKMHYSDPFFSLRGIYYFSFVCFMGMCSVHDTPVCMSYKDHTLCKLFNFLSFTHTAILSLRLKPRYL